MMSLLCKQQEGRHSRDCFCLKISAFDSQPCIELLYSMDSTGMNLESACTAELQLKGAVAHINICLLHPTRTS